jgi:uncharacterized protein YndB with AHSA1/START domain
VHAGRSASALIRQPLPIAVAPDLLEELHPGSHPFRRLPLELEPSAAHRTEVGPYQAVAVGPVQPVVPSAERWRAATRATYDRLVSSDGLSFEITRMFSAPRARVFEFFAHATQLARWWGPRGFSIPKLDYAPRVGAAYRIQMQPPAGEAFHLTGIFRDVDAPSSLAFTFEWEPADPDDQETLAEVSFRVIDDGTEVHVRQGPFRTEARRELHRDGWTESLEKLGEVLP